MIAALREGLALGYRDFRLYGGMGGRIDHTVANIQALAFLCENGAQGILYGEGCTMTAIQNGTYNFVAGRNGYVSVFSFSEVSSGVTLRGLKYPLDRAMLSNAFPLGTSNEFMNCPGSISVENGTLLIIFTDKKTQPKP
jgi:thiamine pyrophosphokinase